MATQAQVNANLRQVHSAWGRFQSLIGFGMPIYTGSILNNTYLLPGKYSI